MLRKIFRVMGFLSFCFICIETSAQNKSLQAVHARLKNKEIFKKQVIQAITGRTNGGMFIDLANDAAETIDEVDKVVQGVISSNEFKPPPPSADYSSTANSRQVPNWIQNFFDEVVNYVITEKDKEEILPDPPPDASYDYCFNCDKDRKAQYSRDTAAYLNKFFSQHGDMISKGIQVIKYFEWRIDKKLPYDREAASRMTEKMKKDVDFLRNDMVQRVLTTWNLYKNNATHLSVLNQLVLAIHRYHELQRLPVPAELPDLNAIGQQMYTTFTKYYDDAVQRRDYTIMLNVNWYIGLLRTMSLLYGEIPVPEKLFEFMQSNRFEMKIDVKGEMDVGEGKSMMAKLSGTNYYRAAPDSACKLRWYLIEPDIKNMQFHLDQTELKVGVPAKYEGTRDYQSPPADILLGFCDKPTRDSLILLGFQPIGEEKWTIDGKSTSDKFVQSILLYCFMNEEKVRSAPADMAKYQQMQQEMMEAYQAAIKGNEHLIGKDPATMTNDERAKFQKIVSATKTIQNKLSLTSVVNSILINGTLQNNLKTVFEKEVDGRELFPSNTNIIYARFKVDILHVE